MLPRSRRLLSSALVPAAALAAVWWLSTTIGPFSSIKVNDLYVYSVIAGQIKDGAFPYRDFTLEYPPLSLIPVLIAGGNGTVLSWLMLGCALVTQAAVRVAGGARAAWLMVLMAPVAGALVATHIDLFPVALTMAGAACVLRGRATAGMVLLGLATMAKLWPVLIAACALVWLHERRAALQGPLIALVATIAVLGLPFAAAGGFPQAMVRFHLERPVQIESSPAAVLSIIGGSQVTGTEERPDRFKSNGLDGGAAGVVGVLFTVALALTLLWCLALARRDFLAASLTATLAFVALGKVLSPQYVTWLLPFAAIAATGRVAGRSGQAAAGLVAAASLLTQAWFPERYFDVVDREDWAVAAVVLRDALLLAALAAMARGLARSPEPAGAPARSG